LVNKRVGKIIVTNRTRENAEELVASIHSDFPFQSEVVDFEEFKTHLGDVDLIISSTGSDEPLLYGSDFDGVDRKILAVDIAVPRDIDPSVGQVCNVVLRNIDDLHSIIDEAHENRVRDLPKVKGMVIREMVEFLTWYYLLPLMPAYERTGTRASAQQRAEMVKIKERLKHHLPEIHKLAAQAGGDFRQDLESHHTLINSLRMMSQETVTEAV
jgi:glutamyl-tRNA reductase